MIYWTGVELGIFPYVTIYKLKSINSLCMYSESSGNERLEQWKISLTKMAWNHWFPLKNKFMGVNEKILLIK